jgi:hypothetical protein
VSLLQGTGGSITDIEQWLIARGANLTLWAEGTLFQAERSPWTEGDEVTNTDPWADESGNTNDALPQVNTAGKRPVYRDGSTSHTASGGKPVIEFDGFLSAGNATFDFEGGTEDDVWTLASHPFSVNDRVRFTAVDTGATEYAVDTDYFVVGSVATNEFRLSATFGGAPIEGSSDSSGTWTIGTYQNSFGLKTSAVDADVVNSPYTILAVGRIHESERSFGAYCDGLDDTNQNAIAWPTGFSSLKTYHTDSGSSGTPQENTNALPPFWGPTSIIQVWDSDRLTYINGREVPTTATGLNTTDFRGTTIGSRNETGTSRDTRNGWMSFFAVVPGVLSAADRNAFTEWAGRYDCPNWTAKGDRPEFRRVREWPDGSTATAEILTTAPTEGDLMIVTISAAGSGHSGHTVTDTVPSSTPWTKIAGRDVATYASISMWYKVAESGQTDRITAKSNNAEVQAVEIRVVTGVDTLVQTHDGGGAPSTTATVSFDTQNVTPGNYLVAGLVLTPASNPPHADNAEPGKPLNWTGGWHGATDTGYQLTASKMAAASDTTASGQARWTNSLGWAWVTAEFG